MVLMHAPFCVWVITIVALLKLHHFTLITIVADCVPPMVVIGTSSGLLYHCIVIESECDDEKEQIGSDFEEMCSFVTCSNIEVIIPETVLYVLETIELSFPLTTSDQDEFNSSEVNTTLRLMADIRDPRRYFCLHSFGIHIVMLSFCKQLLSLNYPQYHEEKSIVEYLICTRPTIEKSAVYEAKNGSHPVGLTLFVTRGFTYIAVLLNSAELICKRLSNVILPQTNGDVFPVKNSEIDFDYVLSPNKKSTSTSTVSNSRKTYFPEHIEKLLQRSTSLPLIRSSKSKASGVSVQELDMLLNCIDVLKKEYLEKFSLAAKSIEQRKKVLKNMCQIQVSYQVNVLFKFYIFHLLLKM